MSAGRPRKPTNVLELKGAFKEHPSRGVARENEPVSDGEIGDPPEHLEEAEKAAWLELVGMAHKGTLCSSDRAFMEYAAKVWMVIKQPGCPRPDIGIRFESIIGRLGMSPSDRSKVSVIKPKDNVNPFGKFAAS